MTLAMVREQRTFSTKRSQQINNGEVWRFVTRFSFIGHNRPYSYALDYRPKVGFTAGAFAAYILTGIAQSRPVTGMNEIPWLASGHLLIIRSFAGFLLSTKPCLHFQSGLGKGYADALGINLRSATIPMVDNSAPQSHRRSCSPFRSPGSAKPNARLQVINRFLFCCGVFQVGRTMSPACRWAMVRVHAGAWVAGREL
jgi:hypothetical protein